MRSRTSARIDGSNRRWRALPPGVAQQLLAAALADDDADRRRDEDLAALDPERWRHRLGDALGDGDRLALVAHVLEQDRELVAAQPRGGVACPQAAAQARGDRDEQLVTGGVACRVVDGLEAVEVAEQHAD